ncbi:hypothetical protein RHMOL_Rhmol10G0117100 [Rhododendron molle]|uniref:Uncharacterized protein n=1 Tax=Rhododendron molle TaxID=49168 RepID=A0ACC0M2Y5_RHOML|nr:hypothetical protein RHMOL_Rhmol10G0117100 [Rhododendron molle]
MFGRSPTATATAATSTARLVYCWGAKLIKNSHAHPIGRTQFVRLKSAVSAIASELRRSPPYYLPGLVTSDKDEDIICAHKNSGNGVGNALGQSDTCKVVEILNSLREEPCHALSFFDQLKEQGFVHNVSTYMAIIRILCYWGMATRLDSILLGVIKSNDKHLGFNVSDLFEALIERIEAKGPESLIRAFDALVKAYISIGNFDEAIDTLFQTKRRGLIPNIMTCNFLLNRLIESRKNDTAVAVFQQFKRLGLSPNDYSYCIVIKALCRKGSLEEAADIFQEMEEAGLTPNAFTYTTYIEGLCSQARSDLGYEVLKAWREQNIPMDVFTYLVVIRGFVNESKLKEAECVLLDMDEHGVVPDAYCYGSLIRGYCKIGHILEALALHNEMAAKCIKTNCVIVGVILQCLCQMGMADEAVDQFNNFKELGIFLDEVAYNIVVNALCKLGKLEAAVGLLDEMKGKKMSLDVVHYTTLIGGYCLQGKLVDALKLFEEIKEKGLKPDIVTYNVLARGLSRNGLAQEALNLLDYMEGQGLKASVVTHKMIIEGLCTGGKVKEAEMFFNGLEEKCLGHCDAMVNGYCEAGNTREAYELFVKLPKQGFSLSRSSCLKLLSNLCREGENDKALALFEAVLASDDPCKIMYSKLIAAFCSSGDMRKAQWVFDTMVRTGITPDVINYTMMINGYCRVNCLREACEVLKDMKARGIEPDVITYTVLIDGHSKEKMKDRYLPNAKGNKGEQNEVATLWSEMKEIEQKPDVISYTVLIDCHCKSDNLEDAAVLFDEMIDRGLEPDNVTYTALLRGYCRRGYADRAVTLLNDMISRGIQPDSHTMSALYHGILQAKKWAVCLLIHVSIRYMTRKLLDQDFFTDCSCILCAGISELTIRQSSGLGLVDTYQDIPLAWLVKPMWGVIKFLHGQADLTLVPSAALAKELPAKPVCRLTQSGCKADPQKNPFEVFRPGCVWERPLDPPFAELYSKSCHPFFEISTVANNLMFRCTRGFTSGDETDVEVFAWDLAAKLEETPAQVEPVVKVEKEKSTDYGVLLCHYLGQGQF